MSDAPKTIWAMQFDEPASANILGVWGTVNGLERTPRTQYTLTASVAARLKAADELEEAAHKEQAARGNYIATKPDRGGNGGPKGTARHEWFVARCAVSDALTAYRATKEIPE